MSDSLLRDRTRGNGWLIVSLISLTVFLALVAIDGRGRGNLNNGDSDNLVQGARAALDCLGHGKFIACGYVDGTRQTAVLPYPLLQYIPAGIFIKLGFADQSVLQALGWINIVSLLSLPVICCAAFRERISLACIAIAAIVGSSALYQATSAFGEMLSATAFACAILAAIKRRPWWLFAACLFASLGKETLFPFVFVFTILCARDGHSEKFLPERRLLLAIAAGATGGVVLSMGFNIFRFGSARNLLYLDPAFRTPGLSCQAEFFLALFGSPAGGIAWYWPLSTFLLFVTIIVTIRRIWLSPRRIKTWAPTALFVATVAAFFGGLALWYAPFGWIAFGPRLAVPLLVAMTIVALHLVGDTVTTYLQSLGRASLVLMAIVVSAVGVPQYGAPWRWQVAVASLITPSKDCPPGIVLGDRAYFGCVSHVLWRRHPFLLDDTTAIGGAIGEWAWLFAVIGVGSLVLVAGREAHRPPESSGESVGSTDTPRPQRDIPV